MTKDSLKSQQPVAYRILYNALSKNKLAHSYLFSGPKNSFKIETAYLFAQSLICEKGEVFACDKCSECQRLKSHYYSDFIFVEGKDGLIKKEAILNIISTFSKTALEAKGKKIYLINLVENLTLEAANALLKFLEEPDSNDTIAILISDDLSQVLATIKSRCQIINFNQNSYLAVYNECLEKEILAEDAYLLSKITLNTQEVLALSQDPIYKEIKVISKNFVQNINQDPYQVLRLLHQKLFTSKDDAYQKTELFLNIIKIYLEDVIMKRDESFALELSKDISIEYGVELLKIILTQLDKMDRYLNLPLLIDELIYKVQEVTNEQI